MIRAVPKAGLVRDDGLRAFIRAFIRGLPCLLAERDLARLSLNLARDDFDNAYRDALAANATLTQQRDAARKALPGVEYAVESIEWGNAITEVEVGTTRITVRGTIPKAGAGDTIFYRAALRETP